MSNENINHKKDLEELAREAGVYLSPDRLSALEQRLKRRASGAMGILLMRVSSCEYGQRPIDWGTTRAGRAAMRKPDRVARSARSGWSSSLSPRQKNHGESCDMSGPRLRRFA